MKQPWQAVGLGAIAFVIGFGISSVIERDLRKASVVGLVALAGTSAGVVVAKGNAFQTSPTLSSASKRSAGNTFTAARNNDPSSSDVAVFWDYENIKASFQGGKAPLAESLVDYATGLGAVRTKMIYSNWRREHENTSRFFYSLGFEPIHVDMGKTNSVDLKLAVDSLSIAYQNPDIETFILVSGDKDFVPLVNGLKDAGKRVILVGQAKTTSSHLKSSADEFIDLTTLLETQADSHTMVEAQISFRDAADCLHAAVRRATERQKSTRLPAIDLLMRDNSDYAYAGYQSIETAGHKPFSNFSDFVRAVAKEGRVRLITIDGYKEVRLPGTAKGSPSTQSNSSSQTIADLTERDWHIIIEQIKSAFEAGQPGPTYGRYLILFAFVRTAKKDGRLPYPNRVLKDALTAIVDGGLLVVQPDESYRLTDKLDDKLEAFLQQHGPRESVTQEASSQEPSSQKLVSQEIPSPEASPQELP